MNPGYLSWLLMVISLILFASGWKDILMRGMTSRVILLFFVSFLIGIPLFVTVPGGRVSLWLLILLGYAGLVLWKLDRLVNKLHVISVGILVGSLSFFMQETVYLFSSLVLGSLELTMALVVGLLVVMTLKLPSVQIAMLTVGLSLGEFFYLYIHQKHTGMELGSLKLLDRWWLNVFITRGLSMVMRGIFLAGKQSLAFVTAIIKLSLKNKLGNKE
ncbi:hypothetical protein [Paenibacillus agricola]|uniref:Uncharacterized protein n=1 Tax=Paenibacillus agricola TaxID=2716264 RepID=A0ABX0IZ80_9BACL|nr:hypothetical protein [Paenibacillus agricola]NHN28743.1 hypothetical protein [Paenibacillus agricola]